MTKRCYYFGGKTADGSTKLKNLLGGKGANLAEMVKMGLSVPAGFTITTDTCTEYNSGTKMGAKFCDVSNPLLLSIRSGARVSMPGMMDTILNVGLTDETVEGLVKLTGDARFAYDSYRRLIQMYADIVLGVAHHDFEVALETAKKKAGATFDKDLTPEQLKALVGDYKAIVLKATGKPFPQDPRQMLEVLAISAHLIRRVIRLWQASISFVFESWMNDRACHYRDLQGIPEAWGTAVTVQAMVFGNMGETSCTGVAFTRDPSTGERRIYGEFLSNAQGEDVVAGIRTPQPLLTDSSGLVSLEQSRPETFKELVHVFNILEQEFHDMQDIEFTVQKNKLYMLQTRNAKRTAAAQVVTSVDMAKEGLISKQEAVRRVTPDQIEALLHPQLDKRKAGKPLAKGLPASPGGASGAIVYTAKEAEAAAERGEKVLLVRIETSPEDLRGMTAAQGILTARGGMTSHAAVVTRQMGKPCVCGLGELQVDLATGTMTVGGKSFKAGEMITIDGSTGEVYPGELPRTAAGQGEHFTTLMGWADEFRRLGVWTNADNGRDAKRARDLGAEGIGLVRTEHMFFEGERIHMMREVILAQSDDLREAAIERLLPLQQEDFEGIFTAMDNLPVTVRLLDPPLHEFLPNTEKDCEIAAGRLGIDVKQVHATIESLHEQNPMLGHRGCRLGVTFPSLYMMQVRAIMEAAVACSARGLHPHPKIMIPLVSMAEELQMLKGKTMKVLDSYKSKFGPSVPVGTMIELPRACIMAHDIAKEAEFFSFGTNDLTQTTFGISRDDANTFLPDYKKQGLVKSDPFAVLDPNGVGGLIKIACEGGRRTRPDLSIGICGEHGGNPQSIMWVHTVPGVDYVSCSPLRVPVARMAAAHAAIADLAKTAKSMKSRL